MFWNYRDELSVENQMVFNGHRIVVPVTLQHTIMRHLHEGHMGLEKMLLRARSAVFLPRLTTNVNNLAKNCECETCQKHAPKQDQKQIIVHEPTATKPWPKLASDIFDIKWKSYIVFADVLGWTPLSQRRQEARLILFYKIINGLAQVPFEGVLVESRRIRVLEENTT